MSKKYKILSIDDDKFIHKLIGRTLESTYETMFALTGEEGINLAKFHKPDIIITDVEMPGLNGYEVCERLKSDPSTSHIPVVFLSSLNTLQERLLGFESGADDYLVKPFDAEDLTAKLSVLIRYSEEQEILHKKIEDAQKTAYIAMTGSSELGQAMQLIEQSFSAVTHEELAELLLSYARSKELNCTVHMLKPDSTICLTTQGMATPLETELMELLRAEEDRFRDFGCRTHINFPNMSVLIKNMPLDDMAEYARIKDSFPPIMAAYDAKIKALNIDNVIREQSIALNESFRAIKETIKVLGSSLHENAKLSFTIMSDMLSELNMTLPAMGLEDDQEEYILNKIESAVDSTKQAANTGEDISASFDMVISQLQSLVDQQNELLDSSVQIQKEKEIHVDKKSGDGSMDVELF